MSDTTRNRIGLVLAILIVIVATWAVVDAHNAMFPTPYTSTCEVGLLNGTYSECE